MNHGIMFLNHDTSYIKGTAKALSAGVPPEKEKPIQHLLGPTEAERVTKWLILYRKPKAPELKQHYRIPDEMRKRRNSYHENTRLTHHFDNMSENDRHCKVAHLGEILNKMRDRDERGLNHVSMRVSIPGSLLSPDGHLVISGNVFHNVWLNNMEHLGRIIFFGEFSHG